MPAIDNIGTTTTTTTVKVSLGLPAGLTPAELLYVALLLSLVLMLGMLAGLLFFLYVVDFRSTSCSRTGYSLQLHLPHCCLQTHTDLERDSGPECEHCRACVAIAAWRDGRDCALRNLQQHFPNASTQIADEKIPDGEDMGPYSA